MILILKENRNLSVEGCLLPITYRLYLEEGGYAVDVKNERTGETVRIQDLTTKPETARTFFNRVVQGMATPVTLQDLAEDFLAE